MEQLVSAATIIVIFVLGAFFASLISTGRLQTYFSEMSRSMLGYTLLGVALFLAVWILGPWGLAVVLVPVVLYQAIGVRQRAQEGQDVTPPLIYNVRRWLPRWLGGYPKVKPEPAESEQQVEPAPVATEPEGPEQVESQEVVDTRLAEFIKHYEGGIDHQVLVTLCDTQGLIKPPLDTKEYLPAALTRLKEQGRIRQDGHLYFPVRPQPQGD